MSDSDDLEREREEIRREKMEELKGRAGEGADGGSGEGRASDSPVHVEGSGHLQDIVASHDVVLVDYYADWCGPCKMLEPVLESVAADTGAVVAKVDIDRHQGLAAESNVRGVPTLVVYADGQPAERLVGVQDESRLRSLVQRLS